MVALLISGTGLIILLALQAIWPRREFPLNWRKRWGGAAALIVIGSLLARLVLPIGLVGVATITERHQSGLFNIIDLPIWPDLFLGIVLLDFAVWLQHVAMHRVEPLWRLHRVHHTDPGFDVTTALRFHPFEFLVSLGWKALIIWLLGVDPITVVVFVIALNGAAMFNHSNIAIPISTDQWLRWVIVTPDMHRVHHSTDHHEANTNFGFLIPWWDRLFKMYQDQPEAGHKDMALGNEKWREARAQSPFALLKQPFD